MIFNQFFATLLLSTIVKASAIPNVQNYTVSFNETSKKLFHSHIWGSSGGSYSLSGSGGGGWPTGAILAVAIGIPIGLAILTIIFCLLRNRKIKQRQNSQTVFGYNYASNYRSPPEVLVGRNHKYYLTQENCFDINSRLPNVERNSKSIPKGFLPLCYPLRTVLILRILYQQDNFYDQRGFAVSRKYEEFIQNQSNTAVVRSNYPDVDKWMNDFDSNNSSYVSPPPFDTSSFNNECVICTQEFQNMDAVYVLPSCNHYFHPRCFGNWVSQMGPKCPTCGHSIVFDILHVISRQKKVIQLLSEFDKNDEIEKLFWSRLQLEIKLDRSNNVIV